MPPVVRVTGLVLLIAGTGFIVNAAYALNGIFGGSILGLALIIWGLVFLNVKE